MTREEMLQLADAEMQRAQEILESRHVYEMEVLKAIRQLYKPKSVLEETNPTSGTITISRQYLDHLLNCLANQKYLHEMNTESLKEVREENQRIIDEAWNEGMRLLYHNQQAMQATGLPPGVPGAPVLPGQNYPPPAPAGAQPGQQPTNGGKP